MAGSIMPLPIMLEEQEDRKAYEKLDAPKAIVVRFGYMREIAELSYNGDAKPGCGSKLVIRSQRGLEMAEMLTTVCSNNGCSKSVSRDQMLQYIENSGGKDYPYFNQGKVLRVANIEDLNEQSHLDKTKQQKIRFARQAIAELDLPMKLVEVEQLLGGERIIFYYTSENWVDFRELVRKLASEYQTRIEMCQVNARNEARLVADYEKCGQHCCCKQFLKVLKPVSMRSAKVQKATLDPTKISGRCGRLMCCLRYEDQTYSELQKRLPHRQSIVETEDGLGTVINTQILTQLVLIRLDDTPGPLQAYPLEKITVLNKEQVKVRRQQLQELAAQAHKSPPPPEAPKPPKPPEAPEAQTSAIPQDFGNKSSGNSGSKSATGRQKAQQTESSKNINPSEKGGTGPEGSELPGAGGRKPRRRRRNRRLDQAVEGSDSQADLSKNKTDMPIESNSQSSGQGDTQSSQEGSPRKKRRRRRRRRRPGGGEQGGGGTND